MRQVKIKYKYSAAYSLVEIMVAVFITSLVSIAVVSLYTTGSNTFFQIIETSKQSDESIVLFTMIEKDLSRGGFAHPIRSHVDYCGTKINPSDAIKTEDVTHALLGGTVSSVSSCFDKPTTIAYGDDDIERFKVTYAKGTGLKANILFKKIERTDDCNALIVSDDKLSDNAKAIIHDWLPVSINVQSFNAEISSEKPDIVDIEMKLQSQRNPDLMLDFIKRVFVRNQSIYVTSEECEKTCPNAIKPFVNYQISEDHATWNPDTKNIPGGLIYFDSGYDAKTDDLKFQTVTPPLVPTPIDGTLKSDFGSGYQIGAGTGAQYQSLLSSVKYVYDDQGGSPSTKNISLFLFSDTCDSPQRYKLSSQEKVYCLVDKSEDFTWSASNTEAEATKYYKLDGKLLSINDDNENVWIFENSFFEDPIDLAWTGGKKTDEVWKWPNGDEIEDFIRSDSGTSFVDGFTVAPDDYVGENANYLWIWINNLFPGTWLGNSVDNHPGIQKYIIEFQPPLNPQLTCQDDNPGGCVNHYSSTSILIEELNLCHSHKDD
jgi:hypothetical protein